MYIPRNVTTPQTMVPLSVFIWFLVTLRAAKCCSDYLLQEIPDNKITASSQRDQNQAPALARLNTTGTGWCAAASDLSNPFIQVEFGGFTDVVSVITQGRNDLSEWVTKYSVTYSYDGTHWLVVKNPDYTEKVFDGNADQNKSKINNMDKPTSVKFLRIHPKSYHGHPCMKLDVIGCATKGYKQCAKFLVSGTGGVADDRLSASSQLQAHYLLSHARLFTNQSPTWCPYLVAGITDFIQVSFYHLKEVIGVVTRGDMYGTYWVTDYSLEYTYNNYHFIQVLNADKSLKVFRGNTDHDAPKVNMLDYPIETTGLRIYIQGYYGYPCLRFDVLGCGTIKTDNCNDHLVSGSQGVPDNKITASSSWDVASLPARARLDTQGDCWCPSDDGSTHYIQVEFERLRKVTGVITQGRQNNVQHVKSFYLRYSFDGIFWMELWDDATTGHHLKIFPGNYDQNTHKYNMLHKGIHTKFLRIYPQTWNSWPCFRFEVLGCTLEGYDYCMEYLVSGTNGIADSKIVASSTYPNHQAHDARIYKPGINWCSYTLLPIVHIQADFSTLVTAYAVVTQGNSVHWVSGFILQYSVDGNTWKSVLESNGVLKIFSGNIDAGTPKVNIFEKTINLRFIRMIPIGWHGHICLRFDVLGCTRNSQSCSEFLVSGSTGISNNKMAASTSVDAHLGPSSARLTSVRAWCSARPDHNPYFHIEFNGLANVTGIVIQGRRSYNEWITKFAVYYSPDGTNWSRYEENGNDKIFIGNVDRITPVRVQLRTMIQTKYLRIFPREWHSFICARFDVLGCSVATEKEKENSYGDVLPLVIDNTIRQSSIWKTENVSDVDRCILKCHKDGNCLSFSYDQSNRSCSGYDSQFYRNDGLEEDKMKSSYYFDRSLVEHIGYNVDREAGLCYQMFTSKLSQTEAKAFCHSQSTRLLPIQSLDQLEKLEELKENNYFLEFNTRLRVDGEYDSVTSSWRYSNNKTIPNELWTAAGKSPDPGKCVVFTGEGLKADDCDEPACFICGL